MTTKSGKSRTDDFSFPVWRDPPMTPARYQQILRAARIHAEQNRSDPFAFARTFLHMKRGIADIPLNAPSE